MASDYEAIKRDNIGKYGTDIGRVGKTLLADRYDDRTHFIFELLQNAEDALTRRKGYDGRRSITFNLNKSALEVSHYGLPFTPRDVLGICGIGEGTKTGDLTTIGHFGIGFKAVYAFTDAPEIHSGDEHFAIDSYVWPRAIEPLSCKRGETVFVFPFHQTVRKAYAEIAGGLPKLGATTLLFLREIEEICWSTEGGESGKYVRTESETISGLGRRVTLIGHKTGEKKVEEKWLLFSRKVKTADGKVAGYVEVAFRQVASKSGDVVKRLSHSPLVVFFPTIVPTHVGFLVQGPYRTTPSRDNVPRQDEWNQYLVRETSELLVAALENLRGLDLLHAEAIQTLPLDRELFGEDSLLAPLFDYGLSSLCEKRLLPCYGGGHVTAENALLARSRDLRDLLSPHQLAELFGEGMKRRFLSDDITQDRMPDLHEYLGEELAIREIDPEDFVLAITQEFIEKQSDAWIVRFYEFMRDQPALLRSDWVREKPLIRLEDGTHVPAQVDGMAKAFLPGAMTIGFPTVKQSICRNEAARKFLIEYGLTKPDPIDDVIQNVLPKYQSDEIKVNDTDYDADIARIRNAFNTDSKEQREKLRGALQEASFVKSVHGVHGTKRYCEPEQVYLATERLRNLFAGVPNVDFVDEGISCLRGEEIRELLEACFVVRYVRPIEPDDDESLTEAELAKLRAEGGHAETSGRSDEITDWTLDGLKGLLKRLRQLSPDERKTRASYLWDELGQLEERRGKGVFTGEYKWTHHGKYKTSFDAAFVRTLNKGAWVPNTNGKLRRPDAVVFESLGWKPNPFLQSKIYFKPAILETLAAQSGFEPGALELLKKLGLTSVAELSSRLGIDEKPDDEEDSEVIDDEAIDESDDDENEDDDNEDDTGDVDDAIKGILGDAPDPTPPIPDPTGPALTGGSRGEGSGKGGGSGTNGAGGGATGGAGGKHKGGKHSANGKGGKGKAGANGSGGAGAKSFISYVATSPDEEEPDPDGLEHEARMALEEQAIDFILASEPQLKRTPPHNPGFDLFETITADGPPRRVEVKAMTSDLHSRPVGLSHTQFDCARLHGKSYWLYVVEYAGDPQNARIVRIQDPAGKARTFSFDHGWISVAELDEPEADERDMPGSADS